MTEPTPPHAGTSPRPFVLDLSDPPNDPGLAPPVPDAPTGAFAPDGRAMRLGARLVAGPARARGWGGFALWLFAGTATFVLGVWSWNFVAGLMAASPVLGWIGAGLIGAVAALSLIWAGAEGLAYLRLGRMAALRHAATQAETLAQARGVARQLARFYAGRGDVAWARARLAERTADIFDADAILDLAEAELLAPLDALALAEVEGAARQVAIVTALVPMALADVAAALVANLRMIRRIAQIYGGRAGILGSLGLLRRVFVHLLATGAVAMADDLVGSFAGGGVLSKLSRRFGEGVVNGALTARVGLAAMDLCRPMPYRACPRPNTTATVSRALAGLFGARGAD